MKRVQATRNLATAAARRPGLPASGSSPRPKHPAKLTNTHESTIQQPNQQDKPTNQGHGSMRMQSRGDMHASTSGRQPPQAIGGERRRVSQTEMQQGDLGCKHFGLCSGCTLNDSWRQPAQFADAKEFFSQRGQLNFELVHGSLHGWRCRAKLAVRGKPGKLRIGLFKRNSHDVLDIVPGCTIHHPRINQVADLIKQLAQRMAVPPYDEATQAGALRYLQLTAVGDQRSAQPQAEVDANAQVQVVFVVNAKGPKSPAFASVKRLADTLWQQAGKSLVHSVWLHLHSSSSNTILGSDGSWHLLHGPEDTWQAFSSTPVCLGPGSFVQANYQAFQKALSSIKQHVTPGARVLDLHAGVGSIGLSLFSSTSSPQLLRCVEINPSAKAPFEKSRAMLLRAAAAALQQSNGAGVDSGGKLPTVEFVAAAAGSSPALFLTDVDTVIVDPPRKGLEPVLLEALCDSGPQTLVYLSCGWEALKQEFDRLHKAYHLVHAEAFLFFPGTDAIETLCVFHRR